MNDILKIIIEREASSDKDIGYDLQYNLKCEIEIPENATIMEATYAWLEALKVAGYSDERIDELKRKL